MEIHLFVYAFSFVGIWIGSGLAIGSVVRLSRILRISSFLISFLVLGIFTSISELSVGVNSILENDPEIFVGNLIGASIVLFMLLIPLLAIFGNNIKITPEFQGFNLPASLVVIALPVLLALDGQIDRGDSYVAMVFFGLLVVAVEARREFMKKIKKVSHESGTLIGKEFVKIIFGIATIFVASKFVVEQTEYFSLVFNVTPFLISLVLIAIGTNIPELSLVIRSLFMKNNQIAFGDYVGSAAFNTFLIGALTLFYGKSVYLTNSYVVSLLFLVMGLAAFYYFARTKNSISRMEGFLLFGLYISFILTEIYLHKGVFNLGN